MPSDGSQDGSGGGEYENANAAAKHADASHGFRISHSLEASPPLFNGNNRREVTVR
jgi:hypothetical protein